MPSTLPKNITLRPGESIDEFMEGRLRLIQSKTGYRFSVDAVFLSEFVTIRKGDFLIDIGTGCGIIPLLLLLTKPVGFALGLEIQPNLADQAGRNVRLNGLDGRMGVVLGDVRSVPLKAGIADVVICNPPYRPKRNGRLNPDIERAIARHEITTSMDDIIDASQMVLREKGRLALIYPAARLADLMVRMRRSRLEPKRIRVIYPGMNSEAKLVLIEALKGGGPGVKILPPIIG
ncbi:MAG: methyltransferase [Deltaproteobacteria bacterium]|nr:methyltransferase [Deltaproteobacteria bacterium]